MSNKIKVILVEDSPLVLAILKRILNKSDSVEVIGTAKNGKEGIELVKNLNPDVICTDLMMPVMDGLEFTKEIMYNFPKPILVISASLEGKDKVNVFNLLQAGAVDVFPKPVGGDEKDYELIREKLISRIKIVSTVPVYKKVRKNEKLQNDISPKPTVPISKNYTNKISYLVIGASTGGPKALQEILSNLPKDFPVPIICVQHISDGFVDSLVNWLGNNSKLKVKIMQEGETPQAGTVYFPINMKHLVINNSNKLVVSNEDSFNGHCPSVNTTFKSFAQNFPTRTLGVLLTGMGDDGATGLLSIKTLGGTTIAEAESSCVVYGMPRVAKEIGAANFIVPLDEIASKILSLV